MGDNRKNMLRQIMNRAWEMAREGARNFGGNAKLYFTCSLRIAWSELPAIPQAEAKPKPTPRTAWHKKVGNRYVLPGVPMPSGPVRKGQFSLPGICE